MPATTQMCAPANNTGGRGGDDGQSRARPSRLSSVTSGEAHVTAAAAHRPPFAIDAHRAKRSYRSEACPPQRFSPTNMLTIEQIVVSVLLMLSLLAANIEAGQHAKQVATEHGQLVIGALFSIREQPTQRAAQTRTCGEVREQYGIHRVEAAMMTIDQINRDPNILPNITLGIEIRDSCWYSAIALEQSIEFIRDAMAASEEKAIGTNKEGGTLLYDEEDLSLNMPASTSVAGDRILGLFPSSPFTSMTHFNVTTPCPKAVKKAKNIVGVIGPASSTNCIQVQNLLQLFNIPQIGYSSTTKDLSRKDYYKFFLRVVPSDHHQAQVITRLFLHFNWTYVQVLYTDGSYGNGLMETFKTNAQEAGICIANMEPIPANGEDYIFDQVIRNLLSNRNAKVVACFCEGSSARALLQAKRRLNLTTEFLFVGSDGWSDRPDVVKGYEKEAQGSLTVRIFSPNVNNFDDYYFRLKPNNNSRNPWFSEFWEMKMNCSLRNITGQNIVHPNNVTFTRQCTGHESLYDFVSKKKPRYKQDNKMSFVVKAIWTMAHGLHNMQKLICKNVTGLCSEMLPINGSILLSNLNSVRFNWQDEIVEFDANGDPPGRYDIMNYQERTKGEYDYVQVGEWDSNGHFIINHDLVQWPREREAVSRSNYTDLRMFTRRNITPESICSKPCPKGQAKNVHSETVKCCWVCVPCRENEYLTDQEKCRACKLGTWPNDQLTGCRPIPVEFLKWGDTSSLVAMSVSIGGTVATLFTAVVFIKHNNTPVVKSSTRELSYAIFIGMFLCYATTFALIAKPKRYTCVMGRVLPGLGLAIIYSALVTKTNRIARILAGSKKRIITKKPRFMSSGAQVIITGFLIAILVSITVFTLVREPANRMLKYPTLERVVLTCNTKVLGISAPLGYNFILIGFCTLYAIKTRNVPENFNEAKFIGFTMYTTLVIWIAFVPIYYNSDENVITLSLCVSFSAIVALVLLFFPKLYIMLFKPEKNNRSYFTTAKNVRCHIGYMQSAPNVRGEQHHHQQATSSQPTPPPPPPQLPPPVSRHSSHSTADFSMESPRDPMADGQTSRKYENNAAAPHANSHASTSGVSNQIRRHQGGGGGAGTSGTQNSNALRGSKEAKKKMGWFKRLRASKQDKVAASVQEHIRAVRAAEALDRQTARRSRTTQSFSEKVDDAQVKKSEEMVMILARQNTSTRRIRIINILRRSFGEDIVKIPVFASIVRCLKAELDHYFIEVGTQTMFGIGYGAHGQVVTAQIEYVDEEVPCISSTLRFRHTLNDNGDGDDEPNKQIVPGGHRNISKAFSSDDSILSVANSVVVEENVSSGGDESSQDSGVYKNIIINLGNLAPGQMAAPAAVVDGGVGFCEEIALVESSSSSSAQPVAYVAGQSTSHPSVSTFHHHQQQQPAEVYYEPQELEVLPEYPLGPPQYYYQPGSDCQMQYQPGPSGTSNGSRPARNRNDPHELVGILKKGNNRNF